jgi:hypothetical protein
MKLKRFFVLFICVAVLHATTVLAQTASVYKLPDSFRFDYTVTQTIHDVKKVSDSSVVNFYYTKSGDYAGAEFTGKENTKGNLFIVLTREGNTVIFDDRNKSIRVISLRKLVSDLTGLMKWIRMDSVMAYMRKRADGKEMKSVKTGNHKSVGSYTTEEYVVTDGRGRKASVWCAKMDFNTQGDYIMNAVGSNMIKMMGSNANAHPLLQTLTQPRTLVTEIELNDSAGTRRMEMQTRRIDQASKTVSVAGNSVNDYSNMSLPEIFQAEMKKRNR